LNIWDFLQTPNPTFNNMPICPFIAGDLQTGNIKFYGVYI